MWNKIIFNGLTSSRQNQQESRFRKENKDINKTSPQTGTNDVLPYAVIMLSIAACGAAVVMLVRTNKSK